VFVPGKPFQPSLIFAGKVGAFQVLNSRVGIWPYPQTLDQAGKDCQGQTLQLIIRSVSYGRKKFYNIDTRSVVFVVTWERSSSKAL
jgi:hypothetical protein